MLQNFRGFKSTIPLDGKDIGDNPETKCVRTLSHQGA